MKSHNRERFRKRFGAHVESLGPSDIEMQVVRENNVCRSSTSRMTHRDKYEGARKNMEISTRLPHPAIPAFIDTVPFALRNRARRAEKCSAPSIETWRLNEFCPQPRT